MSVGCSASSMSMEPSASVLWSSTAAPFQDHDSGADMPKNSTHPNNAALSFNDPDSAVDEERGSRMRFKKQHDLDLLEVGTHLSVHTNAFSFDVDHKLEINGELSFSTARHHQRELILVVEYAMRRASRGETSEVPQTFGSSSTSDARDQHRNDLRATCDTDEEHNAIKEKCNLHGLGQAAGQTKDKSEKRFETGTHKISSFKEQSG